MRSQTLKFMCSPCAAGIDVNKNPRAPTVAHVVEPQEILEKTVGAHTNAQTCTLPHSQFPGTLICSQCML